MRSIRIVAFAALMLLLPVGMASADLGEDFEPGGIALLGSGSLYYDLGSILDSSSQYNSWSLSLGPEVDFLFQRNSTFYLAPYFAYSSRQLNSSNITRSMYYGAVLGFLGYLVPDSKAMNGLVPALGVAIGFELDPGVGDKVSGVETTDSSLYTYVDLMIPVRFYYFINDRLAPYLSIVPRVWYEVGAINSSGSPVTLTFAQRVYMDVGIYFGMSLWVPRKKISL